jgi:S-adenosylmethionine:tRNA ribosyltransferase-isomerase
MLISDFHFHLPDELIAQAPLAERDQSRMLVLDRSTQTWQDSAFREFPTRVRPGDCLVINNTRVFPSRLLGQRQGVRTIPARKQGAAPSGEVEVFLTLQHREDPLRWDALVRPGKKLPVGEQVVLGDELRLEIVDRGERGIRVVRFDCHPDDLMQLIQRHGHVPLPPYIRRADNTDDRERYQTVYADKQGSVAAPTAGLHFTPHLLEQCRQAGAVIAEVTLHVGLGTFMPLTHQEVEKNSLHVERFEISPEAAERMNSARRRVVIGTTSARTVESASVNGKVRPGSGETSIFIYPGYRFRAVDALLTNFHLPESSLLMLVCAFAGKDFAMDAYRHAVDSRYRFFSYGDCMFIE